MPPRNPSELARLEDELNYWLGLLLAPKLDKKTFNEALDELEKIRKQLGYSN